MSTKRGAAQFSAKPGHYAIGLRDGGSEWHIGTDLRRECPSCTAPWREGSDPASPEAALDVARTHDLADWDDEPGGRDDFLAESPVTGEGQ